MQKRATYCCVLKTEAAGPVQTSAPANRSARNHSPQDRDIDTGEPQNPIKTANSLMAVCNTRIWTRRGIFISRAYCCGDSASVTSLTIDSLMDGTLTARFKIIACTYSPEARGGAFV
jgi:hypothetical protein